MRDNKKLNKTNMILRFIPLTLMVLLGIFIIVVSILGALEHYGIISNTWTISNFSWFSLILTFIMAFCFIYFPIRSMINYVKRFKNKSFTREVNTYVVASQTKQINLTDVEAEHNRNLKQTNLGGETQQTNTKPNNALIGFLSAIIGVFAFAAILCIINAIMPNPWMSGTVNGKPMDSRGSWKIGVLILSFLLPFILWLSSLLKIHYAIKHNKPIKQSTFGHYAMPFAVLIPLGVGPFMLINDPAKFKEPLGIFYMSFWVFLFGLFTYGYLHDVIKYHLNKKLLNSKTAVKNKARYIGCKYSNSTSQNINGVPTRLNVKYKVKFAFTDENGIERTITSAEEYTFKEVAYLKYKQDFEILSHKKRAIIVEDLTNIEIPNNVNNNIEKTNSKTFLPSFARKNRWLLTFLLSLVIVAILEVAGIGMWINPEGNNTTGIVCVIIGVIIFGWSIYYSVPSILAEYKGKETYGKLLKLEVDHRRRSDHDTNRKYAIVELNGEVKNIYLLYDEWYSVLGEYVGKEIPLKVFGKTAVVDFQKMYSDLI
ncbi:MAG: hypothetical protein E7345_05530 [Clostridiales bacterium]|nr:hypothetical protein [Clostridiales bacterium]